LALSCVGQPHPSAAGSRTIRPINGLPQYETPRCTTRNGHRSQIIARLDHEGSTANIRTRRNFAAADLAAARESVAKTPLRQKVQAISFSLSDVDEPIINRCRAGFIPPDV